jgi:hypothetical protein
MKSRFDKGFSGSLFGGAVEIPYHPVQLLGTLSLFTQGVPCGLPLAQCKVVDLGEGRAHVATADILGDHSPTLTTASVVVAALSPGHVLHAFRCPARLRRAGLAPEPSRKVSWTGAPVRDFTRTWPSGVAEKTRPWALALGCGVFAAPEGRERGVVSHLKSRSRRRFDHGVTDVTDVTAVW